ncbi:hypothetical protein [Georgenia faecalis]|nr:hypothetical protein [Georgenia faecalis]
MSPAPHDDAAPETPVLAATDIAPAPDYDDVPQDPDAGKED